MTIIPCDVYQSVMDMENHCEVDVMGTNVETPCVASCIASLTYAVHYCSNIYGHTDLLNKIISLLKKCENPLFKESFFQNN
tara:strand:+ start:205 stop:447 length:243 start_codon:yes stop_codon:yes gene_type:complete